MASVTAGTLQPPIQSTSCALPGNMLRAAAQLVDGHYSRYSLESLFGVLEALVVYDHVYIYEFHPYGEALRAGEYWDNAIVERLNRGVDKPFRFAKLRTNVDAILKEARSLELPRFETAIIGSEALTCPQEFLDRAASLRSKPFDEAVSRSMSITGMSSELARFEGADRELFVNFYLGNRLWQLSTAGKVVDGAAGTIYAPHHAPLVEACWHELRSTLHHEIVELQKHVRGEHLPPGFEIDSSPLAAVFLDTTLSTEMIPDTLFLIRRDFSELRDIGRRYYGALSAAPTYRAISDLTMEWRGLWKNVISRVGVKQRGVLSRILTLDRFSSSPKTVAVNVFKALCDHVGELYVRNSISAITALEEEFLDATPTQHSIARLFGDEVDPRV